MSAFKASLPAYAITKTKLDLAGKDPDAIFAALKTRYRTGVRVNTDDGLKLDFPDSWVHLRKSNTEPIVRIIAEAPTEARARELVRKVKAESMGGA